MPADPQLLTKQVIEENLTNVAAIINVRFNLQRGKIARIWGLSFSAYGIATGNREITCFVRKGQNVEFEQTPSDILWASNYVHRFTTPAGYSRMENHVMFPKPYRTTGVSVQINADGVDTGERGLVVFYYDIDEASKGDMVQRWEKSRSKKYDRRMLSP